MAPIPGLAAFPLAVLLLAVSPALVSAQPTIAVLGASASDELRLAALGGRGRELAFVSTSGPELLASHRCDSVDRACLARIALSFDADWLVLVDRSRSGEVRLQAFDASPCRMLEPIRVAEPNDADADIAAWVRALDARIQARVDRDALRAAALALDGSTEASELPVPHEQPEPRRSRPALSSSARTLALIGAGIGGSFASLLAIWLGTAVVSSFQ